MESSTSDEFQVNNVPSTSCGATFEQSRTKLNHKTRAYSKPYNKR